MGWLSGVWRFAFGQGVTSALRWLTLYLVALGLAMSWGFADLQRQRHEACVVRNEATADAVQIGAESLIEVAAEADEETVEAYRRILARELDEAEVEC